MGETGERKGMVLRSGWQWPLLGFPLRGALGKRERERERERA